MHERLRCAVIGTGAIGLDHLNTLLHCPRATAVAVADTNPDRLKEATDRYKLGIDSYLNVIVAQTALLGNRQTLVNLRTQLMTASIQLIEALGGGWNPESEAKTDRASKK